LSASGKRRRVCGRGGKVQACERRTKRGSQPERGAPERKKDAVPGFKKLPRTRFVRRLRKERFSGRKRYLFALRGREEDGNDLKKRGGMEGEHVQKEGEGGFSPPKSKRKAPGRSTAGGGMTSSEGKRLHAGSVLVDHGRTAARTDRKKHVFNPRRILIRPKKVFFGDLERPKLANVEKPPDILTVS